MQLANAVLEARHGGAHHLDVVGGGVDGDAAAEDAIHLGEALRLPLGEAPALGGLHQLSVGQRGVGHRLADGARDGSGLLGAAQGLGAREVDVGADVVAWRDEQLGSDLAYRMR